MAALTCQCARDPELGPCLTEPTQEDILCDGCRHGCARVAFTIGDQPPVTGNHVELVWESVAAAIGVSPEPHRLLPDGIGYGHD